MASFVVVCQGATSVPVYAGDLDAACAAAGGAVAYVEESSWGLPNLTLADGGLIGGAILALWAVAWSIRQLARQIRED